MTGNIIILLFLALCLIALSTTLSTKKTTSLPPFQKRALLNKSEQRVYHALCDGMPDGWNVMCQVSYGSFLKNRSFKRYATINSKRADFIVVDPSLQVAAVIEYQGTGHYGNSAQSRERAIKSDKTKREATTEARITFVEVPAKFQREDVISFVQRLTETKPQPAEIQEKRA